jgi:hypothetical protein
MPLRAEIACFSRMAGSVNDAGGKQVGAHEVLEHTSTEKLRCMASQVSFSLMCVLSIASQSALITPELFSRPRVIHLSFISSFIN